MCTYGAVLKDIRKSKKMTQEDLCEGIISRRTLCNFENEKSLITFDVLCKLLSRLNIGFDEFLSNLKIEDNTLPYHLLLEKTLTNEEYQAKLRSHWRNYQETHAFGEKVATWIMILCDKKHFHVAYESFAELLQEVQSHLFQIDDWKRSEILLFLAALEHLDESQIQIYEEDVYYKATSSSCYKHELAMYFVKRGLTIFNRKVTSQMDEFLARFQVFIKEHPCQMYEQAYFFAFKSLYSLTFEKSDHIKFHRAIAAFSNLGFYNEASDLLEMFRNY